MKHFLILAILMVLTNSCMKTESNPFFVEWNTPHNTPPFNEIKSQHYLPAFIEGIKQQKAEIEVLINNRDSATFENTLVALDKSGSLLHQVSEVFFNMTSAHTNDTLQAIAKEVSSLLTAHRGDIDLNPALFARVKAVYNSKELMNLNTEQLRLIEKIYDGFVRGGANLDETKKQSLREIDEKLSALSLTFGDNVLAETNNFELIIDTQEDLKGLPKSVIEAGAKAAKEKGYVGKWLYTTHKPSMIPFITYAQNRDLREKLYRGYFMRGDNNNAYDNKAVVKEIVNLRIKRAQLFGFKNHASYVLDKNMAKEPTQVYDLITSVWKEALPVAKQEVKALQAMIDAEGGQFSLESWDWWYYSEKVRNEKYALSEEALMPYFELENVRNGIFDLAGKLYGLTFNERTDIQVYHPDVKVFEVKESDGTHVGILYTDYFVRPSKRGGAWMNSYRKQERINGKMVTPIITNVCNFPAPTESGPSLLSWDNVLTMFHEFGHGLHGLLSDCNYYTLSGTAVARDFVELPSQIMENWAGEPEVLKMYARHYKTGELIPDALIEKLTNSAHFNQGFATVEYVAAALLDMAWHTQSEPIENLDVNAFEEKTLTEYGLMSEIISRYRSTYFSHIFSGGYSSGYYAYMWAEVLDADAFNAFKETNVFDRKTAADFRNNVLSKGGTEDPMALYLKFRGKKPNTDALLVRRGLKNPI